MIVSSMSNAQVRAELDLDYVEVINRLNTPKAKRYLKTNKNKNITINLVTKNKNKWVAYRNKHNREFLFVEVNGEKKNLYFYHRPQCLPEACITKFTAHYLARFNERHGEYNYELLTKQIYNYNTSNNDSSQICTDEGISILKVDDSFLLFVTFINDASEARLSHFDLPLLLIKQNRV